MVDEGRVVEVAHGEVHRQSHVEAHALQAHGVAQRIHHHTGPIVEMHPAAVGRPEAVADLVVDAEGDPLSALGEEGEDQLVDSGGVLQLEEVADAVNQVDAAGRVGQRCPHRVVDGLHAHASVGAAVQVEHRHR